MDLEIGLTLMQECDIIVVVRVGVEWEIKMN